MSRVNHLPPERLIWIGCLPLLMLGLIFAIGWHGEVTKLQDQQQTLIKQRQAQAQQQRDWQSLINAMPTGYGEERLYQTLDPLKTRRALANSAKNNGIHDLQAQVVLPAETPPLMVQQWQLRGTAENEGKILSWIKHLKKTLPGWPISQYLRLEKQVDNISFEWRCEIFAIKR